MNNRRLNRIAELFDQEYIIDVGSDHGYLPLHLLKNKKVSEANIVEVNKGPLENAQKNTERFALDEYVTFTLSDGLMNYTNEIKPNTGIVVAGMGGNLISQIIEASLSKFKQGKLFLQPNNNEGKLRKYLVDNGFEIEFNDLVQDDGIYYEILVANYVGNARTLSDTEIMFGLVNENNKYLQPKWTEELEHRKNLILNIRSNGHENRVLVEEYQKIAKFLGVKNEIE